MVFDFFLRQSIFGAMVTATGGNKQAARVAGINTDWVKIACFVLTSELATISGLLATASIGHRRLPHGPGMELDTIASTVIGGTSLFGGVGTSCGTFLGTSVLQAIRSGLIMVGINIDWQSVAVGYILARGLRRPAAASGEEVLTVAARQKGTESWNRVRGNRGRPQRGTGGGFPRRVLTIPEAGVMIPPVPVHADLHRDQPGHDQPVNMTVILRTIAFTGVVAVGMTFLIIAGEIDLSVGSVAGLGAIIFGWMMKNAGWSVEAGILAGLATGALCGLINGLLTVKIGLSSFIATLSMLFVARGANYVITSAYPIYPLPAVVGKFGLSTPVGASWAFWIFVALILVGDFVLRQTIFGSMIKATGGNKAGRARGRHQHRCRQGRLFRPDRHTGGLGGMLVVARIKTAEPQIGVGWELDVIATAVMGGVSFFGGVGTILGTFFGSLLMQVVRSGLVVVNVSAHWQNVAVGMLLVAAVVVTSTGARPGCGG